VTATNPDEYIAALEEPRRREIERLDGVIRATPDLERVMSGGMIGHLAERYANRLGKVSVGKSCVRFKRTSDVELDVLRELLRAAGRIGPPDPA
jgi:hypothetical protein